MPVSFYGVPNYLVTSAISLRFSIAVIIKPWMGCSAILTASVKLYFDNTSNLIDLYSIINDLKGPALNPAVKRKVNLFLEWWVNQRNGLPPFQRLEGAGYAGNPDRR